MTITIATVIPAYNAATTLADALNSVVGQTRPPEEVIVVDDGSTDATRDVAESYGAAVRCLSVKNGGVSTARNLGASAATTTHVAFLDADDLWEPAKLAAQVAALSAHTTVRVSTTAAVRVDANLRPLGPVPARTDRDQCRALLLHSMIAGHGGSSALVDHDLFDAVGGFRREFSQCADWDFFLRLSLQSPFAVVEAPLVRYRSSSNNMSSDIALLERDTFAVLDDFYRSDTVRPYDDIRSRVYGNHWMIVAGSYNHAGLQREALRCAAHALRLNPRTASRLVGFPVRRLSRLVSRADEPIVTR